MYNNATLMGRICHDLELKMTPNSVPVLSFRIAVDRSRQTKGEERKSDFFNIVAWRGTAEFIGKYFGKGRMILVEGELQTRQYVKDGTTVYITELIADKACFTGEPKPQSQQPAPPNSAHKPSVSQQNPQEYVDTSYQAEEYPF